MFNIQLLATYIAVLLFDHCLDSETFTEYIDYLTLVNAINNRFDPILVRHLHNLSSISEFICQILYWPG